MVKKGYLEYQGIKIPVQLKMEWRKTVRYSISKKSVNILLPRFYNTTQVKQEISKLQEWCHYQFDKKPELLSQFKQKTYRQNQKLKIFGEDLTLKFELEDRKTITAQIDQEKNIRFKIPHDLKGAQKHKLISQVLSRVCSKYFYDDISERVHYYNETYFKEEIQSIKLKNNQSNWGSCSSQRNINLSSRLLFAPTDVLDYVIVHELSHLKEMNHSPKFWNIVKAVMPDYEEKEDWLTNHGHTLKF